MKFMRAAALAAAVWLSLGALTPARAQSGVAIGYIDMEKVFNGSDARKTGEDRVNQSAATLRTRLQSLRDASLLAPAQWQLMKSLMEKASPSAAEQQQLTSIQGQVTALDGELKTLQQTTQMTDAQKARLNELNGNITANTGNLQTVAGDYDKQISDLQASLRNGIVEDIRKAAQQVAKNRSVGVILNKSVAVSDADAQLLIIAGGVDLTDDVVKQVNANHK